MRRIHSAGEGFVKLSITAVLGAVGCVLVGCSDMAEFGSETGHAGEPVYLVVQVCSDTSMDLSWYPFPDSAVDRYVVHQAIDTAGGGDWQTVTSVPGGFDNSHLFLHLRPCQQYFFRLDCSDRNGNHWFSDTAVARTMAPKLGEVADTSTPWQYVFDSVPDMQRTVPLGPYGLRVPGARVATGPLAAAVDVQVSVPLPGLSLCTLAQVSGPLVVQVRNLSSEVSYGSLSVGLDGAAAVDAGALSALGTATALLPCGGSVWDSVLTLRVTGTGSAANSEGLQVEVHTDSLRADAVAGVDSVVEVACACTAYLAFRLPVAATCVDLYDGVIFYTVTNDAGSGLLVRGWHDDMWRVWYCEQNGFESSADVSAVSSADSSTFFRGILMSTPVPVPAHYTQPFVSANLAAVRLFLAAGPDSTRVSPARFMFSLPVPTGQTAALGRADSVSVLLSTRDMRVDQVVGPLEVDLDDAMRVDCAAVALDWVRIERLGEGSACSVTAAAFSGTVGFPADSLLVVGEGSEAVVVVRVSVPGGAEPLGVDTVALSVPPVPFRVLLPGSAVRAADSLLVSAQAIMAPGTQVTLRNAPGAQTFLQVSPRIVLWGVVQAELSWE